MNPFERRSAASYHRFQAARDASARQERGFKEKESKENKIKAERMPDERSLYVYFHPDAGNADEAEIEKYARIRDLGAKMQSRRPGYFESRHPQPKTRAEICKNIFLCNTWDAEPLLLDDLELAKADGSAEDADRVREMIRAASWMRNPRTDQTIALTVAQEILKQDEAQHKEHARFLEKGKQTELAIVDPDIEGMEHVVKTIEQVDCESQTDKAVTYIEERLAREWDKFLNAFEQSSETEWEGGKKTWPDLGVQLPQKLEAQSRQISKIRQIRDQIYYQRLYPQLCKLSWTKRK
ncbi:hypothetical protein IT407_03295 [Candidatus Uhrbacteria bacterium]|nr:hypothetical protein [Candidatus Uhrbacteria bacterium]